MDEVFKKIVNNIEAGYNAGLKKAMELYIKTDMASCLKSVNFKKRKTIEFLLKEVIDNK